MYERTHGWLLDRRSVPRFRCLLLFEVLHAAALRPGSMNLNQRLKRGTEGSFNLFPGILPLAVLRLSFVRRIQTEGLQRGPDAIANFEVALECLERADYPGGEDAMIWGEYGFAPRFPRPTEPPPIGKLIERFERLREEE